MQTKLIGLYKKSPVDVDKLAFQVYKTLNQKERLFFELEFVSKAKIKKLNKVFRQIDKVTDVLSFPSLDGIRGKVVTKKDFPFDYDKETDAIFLGSIVVCTKRAQEQAKEFGHSVEREITFLICHGLLHLLGYDHIEYEDEVEMKNLQEEIMQKIGVLR